MAKPFHFHLAGIGKAALVDEAADADQVFLLVGVANLVFELVADVEVVFQRTLASAGDHGNLVESCRQCLFDPVLNQGFVHYRQHFLGHRLGCRKESRAISGRRKKAFLDHVSP